MATFSITTTSAQDAAAKRFVDALNVQQQARNPGSTPVTVLEWGRKYLMDKLDALVASYRSSDDLSKTALYQRASPADKAAIDAILDTYRT